MSHTYSRAFFYILTLSCILIPVATFASTTDGTIDSVNQYAWSVNLGWINFGTSAGNVHVTDTQLTGYAWSQNTGWINLNASSTTYVHNDGAGNLSGYAWGEGIGYVAFTGVTIDSSGYFHGYATSTISGQISFNCLNDNSCVSSNFKVQTDWRPASSRNTVSAPASGGNGPAVGLFGIVNTQPVPKTIITTNTTLPTTKNSLNNQCTLYITKYIRYGKNNDTTEVTKLQKFLKQYGSNPNLAVTGVYDDPTYQAVITFQQDYSGDILGPWSQKKPTGYVYKTTLKKINEIYCKGSIISPEQSQPTTPPATSISLLIPVTTSSTTCPYFTKRLIFNSQNSQEVPKLQDFLKNQGFLDASYPDENILDKQTVNAIKAFQTKYSADILSDTDDVPTGYWLGLSIKKANELLGCK